MLFHLLNKAKKERLKLRIISFAEYSKKVTLNQTIWAKNIFIPMLPQGAWSGTSSIIRARRNMREWLFPLWLLQRSAGFRACAPKGKAIRTNLRCY